MDPVQVTRDETGVMRCGECGFRYNHNPREVADLSEEGVQRVRAEVEATPIARLGTRPAPAVWSVNAYSGHLEQASGVILERTRLILTQDRPPLAWFDENEWVERDHLDARPAIESLPGLEQNVAAFAQILRNLPDGAWNRVGVHSRAGDIRLAEAAHDMAHELQHHAQDIHSIGVEGRVPG